MHLVRRSAAVIAALSLAVVPAAHATTGGFTTVKAAKRVALPAWSGTDLAGQPWSTKQLTGKVTVVNIWASWCTYCIAEWPDLQRAATDTPQVRFVGIDSMDSLGNATAWLAEHPSAYTHAFDQRAVIQSSLTTVPSRTLPITIILDKKGKIAAWRSGATTYADLVKAIATVK